MGIFVNKENVIKIKDQKKETYEQSKPTSSLSEITEKQITSSVFYLEIEREVEKKVYELTKNILPDENKKLSDYQKEISNFIQEFNLINQGSVDSEKIIKFTEELALVRPPPLFYKFHLELIKIYYSVALAIKEIQQTDDEFKKIMLYNFIMNSLEKLK